MRLTFGASGLLKERFVGGEGAQVFASANMAHPLALRDAGRADPDAFNVAATYGIATVPPASAGARRFVDFVLGPQGRKTLVELGFGAP